MAQAANVAVATYDGHREASRVVRRLKEAGFDMGRVSVAARDRGSGNRISGYYSGDGGMKYWGVLEPFWGPLWGLLSGWAFFIVPGIGPVLVAGPLAGWIVGILDNGVLFGDMTALGAAWYNMGCSRNSALACEAAVKRGRYLVLFHGDSAAVCRARHMLAEGSESGLIELEAGTAQAGSSHLEPTPRPAIVSETPQPSPVRRTPLTG